MNIAKARQTLLDLVGNHKDFMPGEPGAEAVKDIANDLKDTGRAKAALEELVEPYRPGGVRALDEAIVHLTSDQEIVDLQLI